MKAAGIKWTMSVMLLFFVSLSFAQDRDQNQDRDQKQPIGEVVYMEYKERGIDPALEKYREAKRNDQDRYQWDEHQLNQVGYRIMNEDEDLEAAEKVFRLNMDEYPEAANPRDSYADYLLKKGDKDEARKYLQESVSMAENSTNEDERTRVLHSSKGKLAKLEGKDRQLNFMEGDWEVEGTGYTNGQASMTQRGRDQIFFDEDANALIIRHMTPQNDPAGMRIFAYDAIDDEFDVAYIDPESPQGIMTSKMKVTQIGDNKYEMMDSHTERDGDQVQLRHELVKNSDNQMEWVIYEQDDRNQWQKVYSMNMEK